MACSHGCRECAGTDGCPSAPTNDNARASRFYQMWGMDLCAFHRHGARRSREAKPSLPTGGTDGIPLDHDLEFELLM